MKIHTIRLYHSQELRASLQQFARENNIKAGFIITCVGALLNATVRLPGATPQNQEVRTLDEQFEIVSLVGTLTSEDCHLHISMSNAQGSVMGGHLKSALVGVTAEVVIGEDETSIYERVMDQETGFEELIHRAR